MVYLRSVLAGTPPARGITALLDLIAERLARWKAARRKQARNYALDRLNDHLLDDIGVYRWQTRTGWDAVGRGFPPAACAESDYRTRLFFEV